MSDMEQWVHEQEEDFNPAKAGDDPIWLGGMKYVRADRIEELGAENIKLREAVYIDDLTVTMLVNDKKKALEGVGRALDFLNADMPTEAKTALRATLAELTGGKDE